MSSYFDRVEQGMCDVVGRRAHRPWYVRLRHARHAPGLAVLLAALVVATPAIGAVTNWFGFGTPLHVPKSSPTIASGRALAGTSELLPLRVADVQGGPPWGLRLVHTTRRDVCVQFGRVEDSQLGSLGIDYAWDNDHQFHPFPKSFTGGWGQECATADGAGNAFLNVEWGGIASSANPGLAVSGAQAKGCQPVQYEPSRLARHLPKRFRPKNRSGLPLCPHGTSRTVFMGLLGPDATSITYQAPNGSLQTEHTSGSDGAYLLVFPLTQKTCNMYAQFGPCGSGVQTTSNSFSPTTPGPIKAIRYRDGHTCSLVPPKKLLAGLEAVVRRLRAKSRRGGLVSPGEQLKLQRAVARFAASQHLSVSQLTHKLNAICPAVGYVAPNEKHLTAADLTSPISVRPITPTAASLGAVISFTARQPVTSSDSWYELAVTGPPRCEADGNGPINYGNVHKGQKLTETVSTSTDCKGTIHGVIGYVQNGGPVNEEGAGDGTPGKDGSILVGHFTVTIH
jgi:hypothetical protein